MNGTIGPVSMNIHRRRGVGRGNSPHPTASLALERSTRHLPSAPSLSVSSIWFFFRRKFKRFSPTQCSRRRPVAHSVRYQQELLVRVSRITILFIYSWFVFVWKGQTFCTASWKSAWQSVSVLFDTGSRSAYVMSILSRIMWLSVALSSQYSVLLVPRHLCNFQSSSNSSHSDPTVLPWITPWNVANDIYP